MLRRAVVLLALAAAFVPSPLIAADPQPAVATVGAPIPGDVVPASLLRPATLRASFRVPRADTALYIATPWYVRDLAITLVGPGPRRATLVATDDLPGHMLGLRLPDDASTADRIELEATVISSAAQPYLLPAERLAAIGWRNWWYQALFGLFLALALVHGALAVALRSRSSARFAAFATATAGQLIPWLGIVRPPPEISQPLHSALQALVYVALTLFTLGLFHELRLPRAAARALWALVVLNALNVAGADVWQDFWLADLPRALSDGLTQVPLAALFLAFVIIGIVAVLRRLGGAGFYLAGAALPALAFFGVGLPFVDRSFGQAVALLSTAGQALLFALALAVRLARRAAAAPAQEPAPAPAAVLGPPPANADGLTGIPNRTALDAALQRAWNRARRANSPLAALLLDLDHFKQYNDEYGHLAGDDALRRIAAALAGTTVRRVDDLAGRYGGEEFLVLLPDTNRAGAERIARAAHAAVEALDIAHGAAPSKRLTVSIGLAALVPQHDGDGGELVRRASNALYLAKTMGRNRVVADESPAPQPALP